MNNVIQLEIAREIRALKKFADSCRPLNKGALYDFLWKDQSKPEEVVAEIISSITNSPTFFTELYIALPFNEPNLNFACPVYRLEFVSRGRIRTFEGMGKRGALLEALYWLLLSQRSSIASAV